MPGTEHRSVTPVIKLLRNVLRGRETSESLRHMDGIAARTQSPPVVPGGPNHKSSKVYYYTRDARRLVSPPIDVHSGKAVEAGNTVSAESKILGPGKVYKPE